MPMATAATSRALSSSSLISLVKQPSTFWRGDHRLKSNCCIPRKHQCNVQAYVPQPLLGNLSKHPRGCSSTWADKHHFRSHWTGNLQSLCSYCIRSTGTTGREPQGLRCWCGRQHNVFKKDSWWKKKHFSRDDKCKFKGQVVFSAPIPSSRIWPFVSIVNK